MAPTPQTAYDGTWDAETQTYVLPPLIGLPYSSMVKNGSYPDSLLFCASLVCILVILIILVIRISLLFAFPCCSHSLVIRIPSLFAFPRYSHSLVVRILSWATFWRFALYSPSGDFLWPCSTFSTAKLRMVH
jgi:hypothetical protein